MILSLSLLCIFTSISSYFQLLILALNFLALFTQHFSLLVFPHSFHALATRAAAAAARFRGTCSYCCLFFARFSFFLFYLLAFLLLAAATAAAAVVSLQHTHTHRQAQAEPHTLTHAGTRTHRDTLKHVRRCAS